MIDQIVIDPKKLRELSKPTTVEEVTKLNLVERLRKANDTGWVPGCGLAAIQIGIPLRFVWFKWGEEEFTLLNPSITEYRGEEKEVIEGCLSIINAWTKIKRYYKIKYLSDGQAFSARGLKAQIIQHEIDHVNGILTIDKEVGDGRRIET